MTLTWQRRWAHLALHATKLGTQRTTPRLLSTILLRPTPTWRLASASRAWDMKTNWQIAVDMPKLALASMMATASASPL